MPYDFAHNGCGRFLDFVGDSGGVSKVDETKVDVGDGVDDDDDILLSITELFGDLNGEFSDDREIARLKRCSVSNSDDSNDLSSIK